MVECVLAIEQECISITLIHQIFNFILVNL